MIYPHVGWNLVVSFVNLWFSLVGLGGMFNSDLVFVVY